MAATKSSGDGGLLLLVCVVLGALAYQQTHPDAFAGLTHTDNGDSGYVAPTEGTLTSGYGARGGSGHYGIDIANARGSPIVAVTDGTVLEAGPATGFGLWVRLQHPDDTVTVYGHMHRITTTKGAVVAAGEQIATIGTRGQSTGPHLHFEVWPHGDRTQRIDPQAWLADHGVDL